MYPTSGDYLQAMRSSRREFVVCDAWYGGAPLSGATDLPIDSGTSTDSSTPGVRRQIDLVLQPSPGLYDLLEPEGTELHVRSVLRYPSGITETVPMGVFDLDSVTEGIGADATIPVKGSDRWARIQRAEFLKPRSSTPGLPITAQIATLITEVVPGPVTINVTSTALVPAVVWPSDRGQAIIDLATSIGAWVYFDRDGSAVIDPLPTGVPTASTWAVDAGQTGVLLYGTRTKDRSKTRNVVVVSPQLADGTPVFDPVIVWDQEPASPTYAGTDPVAHPETAGPFGIVPYRYSSPLVTNEGQATVAGQAILTQVTGLAAQLSLTAVRNHALDVLDSISVVLPPAVRGADPVVETHLIDKITHPLVVDGTQAIDTRSTRTDVLQ